MNEYRSSTCLYVDLSLLIFIYNGFTCNKIFNKVQYDSNLFTQTQVAA